MLVAFSLFSASTLAGLLAPVLFLIAIGLGAWAYARVHISKAQEQAIVTWHQNADAQKERAEIAEEKLASERQLKHEALGLLAAERLKTDQTVVLSALGDLAAMATETARMAAASEERIVGAISAQTQTLEKIAAALIKNGNGKTDH